MRAHNYKNKNGPYYKRRSISGRYYTGHGFIVIASKKGEK